jgi:hypothetical protein
MPCHPRTNEDGAAGAVGYSSLVCSHYESPPRLTLVPNEPIRAKIEAAPKRFAAERLLVAVAAVGVSDEAGGANCF